MVREIRFTESAILLADKLAELARPYTGRELALAELRELTTRIDEAYRERRVVTARAVILPQDVSDGVVDIRLVEGRGARSRWRATPAPTRTSSPGASASSPASWSTCRRWNRTCAASTALRTRSCAPTWRPGSVSAPSDLKILVEEPRATACG